jgi:competence protein ComEA
MDFQTLLEKYKIQLTIGLVGIILLGVGFLILSASWRTGKEKPQVEIISSPSLSPTTIWVDIEGAVQNPGVYELPADARINDLLVAAGGLSASADREWLAKNINLAQKLADGGKIYLPSREEVANFGGPGLSTAGSVAGVSTKININTASAKQLESLKGIGEKRAADIIANRPYQTLEELVSKASLPKSVFADIQEQITL